MLKRIFWRLFIIRLSLRWVFQINVGDTVIYNGGRYWLSQGVNDPYWNMSKIGEREYLKRIHRDKFKKERTIKNYVHSFKSGYRFYMGYWFDIWVRDGIQDWMLGCNIWCGKPPVS